MTHGHGRGRRGAIGLTLVAVLAAAGLPEPAAAGPAAEPMTCDRVVTGAHPGALTVTAGVTCLLAGATVLGEVNVRAGAGLVATAAVVQGPISAVGASTVQLTFAQVTGPVLVAGVTRLGSLFGNQVTGPVVVTGGATASSR